MKLGVFGGTFNPIHKSHLYLVESYWKRLMLDKILLVPTFVPPHKIAVDLASAEDRLAMCKLAAKEYPFLEVCDYEIKKEGVSYTYQTLDYLKEAFDQPELYLLMGSDMFLSLQDWRKPEEIIKSAILCTAPREQSEYSLLVAHQEILEKLGADCRVLNITPKPLSSTLIRATIKAGKSAEEYLTPEVYQYIKEHALYEG